MGLVDKPEITDYWYTDPVLASIFAASIMPRNKFQLILGLLHISNNDTYIPRGRPGHRPLHKINDFANHLKANFQKLYVPGEKICVDEAMCAFSGAIAFLVYLTG